MPSTRFIPIRQLKGATPLGNSYLSEFIDCPRSWYNTYYRVDPDKVIMARDETSDTPGSPRGIKPKHTSLPLI